MSKIIKASRITGEYKLSDVKIEKEEENRLQQKLKKYEKNKENDKRQDGNIEKANDKASEIIEKAESEAEKIVKSAEDEARKIKEKAEKEGYDSGYQKGHKEGYEKGKEKGYNKGYKQFEEKVKELDPILNKTKQYMEDEIESLPAEVIDLSLQIASRVINKELNFEPELINNIIYDILEEIGAAHEQITIKVSPEMINYINEVEIESILGEHSVEFSADNSLNPGDCIVETEFGGKDATIENKLDLIEKKLYQGAGYHEEN